MNRLKHAGLVCIVLGVAFADPRSAAPAPRGERRLGIGVTDPKDHDYATAFTEAQRVGLQDNVLSFDWRDLETKPGEFKPETNFLRIANAWYPPKKVPVHLMIRPIHTNQDARPDHLKGKPFDDRGVIASFNALLDWAFAQCPDLEVPSLSIGSESNLWLGDDEARWKQFGTFLKETAAHARKIRPRTLVASEATLAAFTGKNAPRLKALVACCDVVGCSDYPLNEDGSVKDPSAVRETIKVACAFAGDKPVYFYQLGYPSGAGCGSSEDKQATFVRELFAAWDAHAKAVPFINVTWMDDIPAAAVEGYTKYYHFDTKAFRDFLGTLGMRNEGGKPKAAWAALAEETKKRGW
jgi:hypothetical protein